MLSSSKKTFVRRLGSLLCVASILAAILAIVATVVIMAKFPKSTISTTTATTTIATTATTPITATTITTTPIIATTITTTPITATTITTTTATTPITATTITTTTATTSETTTTTSDTTTTTSDTTTTTSDTSTTSETTTTTSDTTTRTSDTTTTTSDTSTTSSTSSTTFTSTSTTTTTACSPMFPAQTTYSTGAVPNPTSVAVIDVNGDSKPDIVVAEYTSNNVGVFLNAGNGTFLAQATYSTGAASNPTSVAVVDVNGDNKPDIVVAEYTSNNVGVFLNAGNGTFLAQTTYSTGNASNPTSVAVVDVNGDNNPDIIVADYSSNNVGVFLNAGNGTFLAQTTYSTGNASNPTSVAVVDVNGDNNPDIIVADYTSNNVGVFLNAGNGIFLNQTTYSTGNASNPRSIAVVDVNSDSKSDIVVAYYTSNNVGVFLNAGNGIFLAQTTYSTGGASNPYSVAVVDVNSDNKPDIIVAEYTSNRVGVFLNTGNGTFLAQTTYSTVGTSNPTSVAVVDVNSDIKPDIVVAEYTTNNVGVFLNAGNGTFLAQTAYSTGGASNPYSVAVVDVNSDNNPDIVVADYTSNNVGVFLNTGNGTFLAQTTYSTGAASNPRAVAVVDVNSDSKPDIVVADYTSNNVGVFLNAGSGTFLAQTTYSTGAVPNPTSVAVVDVNGDNKPDIIVGEYTSNNVGVFLNAGNGTFLAQTTYSTGAGSNPRSIAVVDVNGDSKPDIVVAYYTSNNVGVFINAGNGTFLNQTTYATGNASNPTSVAVVDVNSDNNPDIVVADYTSNNVGVFLNTGNGTFPAQTTYSTGAASNPTSVAAVDVNGDNKPDIVVADYTSNNVGVFLNAGNGTFLAQNTYSTGNASNPTSVAVVDVNSDNNPDIIVGDYTSNNVGVFLNAGNGTFLALISYSTGAGSNPYSVAVVDVNSDSKPDIVVAEYTTSRVGVFLNAGNGTFLAQTTYSTGGASNPTSVAVVDVNSDNKSDIVVAEYTSNNVGVFLNVGNGTFLAQTTYSAGTASNPISVAVVDVNSDSKPDIIVGDTTSNNVGVFLNAGNGTFLAQTTYSTGAASGPRGVAVGDVNNDSKLDIVVADYTSNNVGVFLNAGNGIFLAQSTYSTGNASNPISVVVVDVNSDNNPDIVVAYYTSNNVGVFLNAGNGIFLNHTTYSTGNGSNPRSVAVVDVNSDSKPDIVVADTTSNNVGVFLNAGNGTFLALSTYTTGAGSGPRGVAVGDVNSDYRPDIVVADYSSNNVGVFLHC